MKKTYAQIEQEGRDTVVGLCRLIDRLSEFDDSKSKKTLQSYIDILKEKLVTLDMPLHSRALSIGCKRLMTLTVRRIVTTV